MDKSGCNYTSGNYEKYITKNKLKQKMIKRMQQMMINIIRSEIKLCDEDTPYLLDAGCGEGFITDLIQRELKSLRIKGMDHSEEAVAQAKRLFPAIDFDTEDIYNLGYGDNSFDIVICTEVLEHLTEPARGLSELLRVAKKTIILSVPNDPVFRIGNMMVLKNVTRFGNPIDHIQHWTKTGFLKWVQKNTNCNISYKSAFTWVIVVIHIE